MAVVPLEPRAGGVPGGRHGAGEDVSDAGVAARRARAASIRNGKRRKRLAPNAADLPDVGRRQLAARGRAFRAGAERARPSRPPAAERPQVRDRSTASRPGDHDVRARDARPRDARRGQWERVALDEAQNIKTIDTKQTKAIRSLPARHRLALTGTPVENRLTELHSIMDFLNPGLLGPAATFKRCYATPIERWRDQHATERLRRATGPFILRRLKTDSSIISDLPEKIEMRVDCHLTKEQATLYQADRRRNAREGGARRGDRALGDHPGGADEAQAGV